MYRRARVPVSLVIFPTSPTCTVSPRSTPTMSTRWMCCNLTQLETHRTSTYNTESRPAKMSTKTSLRATAYAIASSSLWHVHMSHSRFMVRSIPWERAYDGKSCVLWLTCVPFRNAVSASKPKLMRDSRDSESVDTYTADVARSPASSVLPLINIQLQIVLHRSSDLGRTTLGYSSTHFRSLELGPMNLDDNHIYYT